MSTTIDSRVTPVHGFAPGGGPPSTGPADVAPPHGVLRRLAERFALIAFGLYHVPLFLNNYPSLGGGGMSDHGLAITWGRLFTPVGVWTARHVFHLTGPMPSAYQGDNGDVGEEFGRLLVAIVVAAIAAVGWTVADRRRPRSLWVGDAVRLLLRFSIALGLASYAVAKLLPVQFPALSAFTLEQHVGDLSPMALLWTFMEYSRAYAFFGGLMEIVVVLLLCFRRTTTLGALLGIVVMTNVALLNWAYGVPVKLYSTMIVVSAVVLVLYDAPRLWAFFATNRAVAPADLRVPFLERVPTWAQWTTKVALVGSVMLSSVAAMGGSVREQSAGRTSMNGGWRITAFALGAAPTSSATAPWRRILVQGQTLAIRSDRDSLVYCRLTPDALDRSALALACSRGTKGALRWTRSGDSLQLSGTLDGAPLTAAAHRLGPADYRLLRAKFQLVTDR